MPPSISFDPVADRYDASRGGERRGERMADLLSPHLDRSGTTVELGVGTGIVATAMSGRGHSVVGFDLSPAMLGRAVSRAPGRVALADVTAVPVGSGAASGAYLVWVLHVVADPAAVVREAVRVVRPGGTIAIVPANAGLGDPDNPDDPVDRAHAPLDVLRPDRPEPADVAAWLEAAGALDVGVRTEYDESQQSPAEAAGAIEQRLWSSLWDLDDATWEAVVAPVIEALRALPDPERPRTRRHPIHLVTGRVP